MMFISLIAAAASETTNADPVIGFQTALLLVIIVCLAFMAKSLADLSRRVRELTEAASAGSGSPEARAVARPSASADFPTPTDAPAPELLAVITAAVVATIDHPVRIVAVDEVKSAQAGTWSLEGRREIFSSHRIR